MAEAKSIVKQQLQAMTEMKERIDKYGHLLEPEDQAFLSEQVALSLRKCKVYMDMEEKIAAAGKTKKEEPVKTEDAPAKKEEPVKAEAAPKKKATPKKKKEEAQVPLIQEEAPAPEEKPAKEAEEPGAKTWEPMAEEEPAPAPEEDLSLDDLLG